MSLVFAFIAMCLVIYLSYVASRYLAKNSMVTHASKYIEIIDRVAVGKDKFIVIAKIGEKLFMMSVSDQKMEKIMDLEETDLIPIERANPTNMTIDNFKEVLQKFINKKN